MQKVGSEKYHAKWNAAETPFKGRHLVITLDTHTDLPSVTVSSFLYASVVTAIRLLLARRSFFWNLKYRTENIPQPHFFSVNTCMIRPR